MKGVELRTIYKIPKADWWKVLRDIPVNERFLKLLEGVEG